jgi:hypothetical protein
MRKAIGAGLLGTVLGTAFLFWVAAACTTRSSSTIERLAEKVRPSTPAEAKPVDTLVPDPMEPIATYQPYEAIDLLRTEDTGKLATEPAPVTPHPVKNAVPDVHLGSSEEQEEPIGPAVDSKVIEERLKSVVQSYLNKGRWGSAAVDTLEFRPSDARQGEFDRIPF